MRTQTTLQTAEHSMAATYVALMSADPWRWNRPVTYSLRTAMNFYMDFNPKLFTTRKLKTSRDRMEKGFFVYYFPDGSRLGLIAKDKTCWEINSEGQKI